MLDKIVQDWLDQSGERIRANDFAGYLEHVCLPLCIKTSGGGEWLVADEAVLRNGFDAWVAMLRDQRATHMIRCTRTVERRTDGSICGLYTTHILKDATPVVPPYDAVICLAESDSAWRCISMVYGLSNPKWPIALPRVSAGEGTPVPSIDVDSTGLGATAHRRPEDPSIPDPSRAVDRKD